MNKKSIIILVIVFLLVLIGWFLYTDLNRSYCWPYCDGMTDQDREDIKKSALEAETKDWKTYKNEEYKFEIEVPVRWKIDDTLTKTICCLDLFSSMEPYDNDRLKTGVTKIQFQNLFNTKSGSKEQFIKMGLEDKEVSTLITNKDSVVEIESENGLKILKFSSAISKNSYFIAKRSDFSEGLLVFVWGEDSLEVKSIISSFKFTN